MRLSDFYDQLGLPEATHLDKKIFKRMILEHGELTSADKKALSEDVEQITWKHTLKPTTIPVLPYEDAEREYLEIAVIEVALSDRRRASRIAEVIQRSVPYPVLLVVADGLTFSLSVAHKRFSLAEKGRLVADDPLLAPWVDQSSCDTDDSFCAALALGRLPQTDFYAMYSGMVQAVVARACAELTGVFEVRSELTDQERREALGACQEMLRQIGSLKTAIHKEQRFAEKVELNTRIKNLEARLQCTQANL